MIYQYSHRLFPRTGLSVGQLVSVTGFSSQFETHYEIDPRSPADIVVATSP